MGSFQSMEQMEYDIKGLFFEINRNLYRIIPYENNFDHFKQCCEWNVNAQVAFLNKNHIYVVTCLSKIEELLPDIKTNTRKYKNKTLAILGKLYKVYNLYWDMEMNNKLKRGVSNLSQNNPLY